MAVKRQTGTTHRYDLDSVRFINPAQVGGIETSVLDDGPGRGVRIAWVNTGSPLRYKVLIDRGLDIADAFYSSLSLSWLSLTGPTPPTRALDKGLDWLGGFFGGLVCSCGPMHVGGPETIDGVEYGLHGTHSNTPAQIESIRRADPAAGVETMSITGLIRTARVFGPNVELRRTISSVLGEPVIHINDVFTNRGNSPARHCWMLHCNFGWPLVDKGTRLIYRGDLVPRADSVKWFTDPKRYKVVRAPQADHCGGGEACAFIDPPADRSGICHVGIVNERLSLGVEVSYPRKHFPRLVNWQHFGPGGEYVTALEPISGGMGCGVPAGHLNPGQSRTYDCKLTVMTEPRDFMRKWDS
ncbi:MAG: DUF4432 family protein [Planctomycetota bacterium]|nr:DUF4432 family protein [Planctomycetota bacterium]